MIFEESICRFSRGLAHSVCRVVVFSSEGVHLPVTVAWRNGRRKPIFKEDCAWPGLDGVSADLEDGVVVLLLRQRESYICSQNGYNFFQEGISQIPIFQQQFFYRADTKITGVVFSFNEQIFQKHFCGYRTDAL